MISDVLFEAVEAIRRYREEMPQVYEDIAPELDRVVAEMERVRIILDGPPPAEPDVVHSFELTHRQFQVLDGARSLAECICYDLGIPHQFYSQFELLLAEFRGQLSRRYCSSADIPDDAAISFELSTKDLLTLERLVDFGILQDIEEMSEYKVILAKIRPLLQKVRISRNSVTRWPPADLLREAIQPDADECDSGECNPGILVSRSTE